MELDSLYESIARLRDRGAVADTYTGTGEADDPDGGVLSDFMEYVCEYHARNRPDWLEAFYQVLTWQFETFHEGAEGYYENLYGESNYEKQEKTADFLKEQGYLELERQFRRGMFLCRSGETSEKAAAAREIREWMWKDRACVWSFCLKILEQHRQDWPEPEERKSDV